MVPRLNAGFGSLALRRLHFRQKKAATPTFFPSATMCGNLTSFTYDYRCSMRYSSSTNENGTGSGTTSPRAVMRPTLKDAYEMPREHSEMSNDLLVKLSYYGDSEASEERLRREIMAVDSLTWEETEPVIYEIKKVSRKYGSIYAFPYKIGIGFGSLAAISTIPLCFDETTAKWFNENYVTTEVPPVEDLETIFEVGSWTWNWMEPPLGQLSFFLLCLQFVRTTMQNISLKPYNEMIKHKRADRVISAFPQYNKTVLRTFAQNDKLE